APSRPICRSAPGCRLRTRRRSSSGARNFAALCSRGCSASKVACGAQNETPRCFRNSAALCCSDSDACLEVTLHANLQQDGVLVLELVGCGWLRRARRERREAGVATDAAHLLVEVEPLDFRRERQVLDGGPAGSHAELRHVEAGVA